MQQPQAFAPDCDALRQQLRAPDPMQRAMALHALEVEVERSAPRPLANEVLRFTSCSNVMHRRSSGCTLLGTL